MDKSVNCGQVEDLQRLVQRTASKTLGEADGNCYDVNTLNFHLPKNIFLCSLVGFKRNLSLLEICLFVPGVLTKWKQMDSMGRPKKLGTPNDLPLGF